MRFSIRLLLVAMAYVALGAAAVGTRNVVLSDALWAATLLAICYAFIVGIIDRGCRQAMAIGFVVVASAHLAALQVAPTRVPAMWIYRAAGYSVNTTDTGRIRFSVVAPPAVQASLPRGIQLVGADPIVSATTANAAATLLAGFFGCWIGAVAYRGRAAEVVGRDAEPSPGPSL